MSLRRVMHHNIDNSTFISTDGWRLHKYSQLLSQYQQVAFTLNHHLFNPDNEHPGTTGTQRCKEMTTLGIGPRQLNSYALIKKMTCLTERDKNKYKNFFFLTWPRCFFLKQKVESSAEKGSGPSPRNDTCLRWVSHYSIYGHREQKRVSSAGLEQQNGHLTQVEVNKMLGLMSHVAAKVPPNDAVPGGVVLLVKLLWGQRLIVFIKLHLWINHVHHFKYSHETWRRNYSWIQPIITR